MLAYLQISVGEVGIRSFDLQPDLSALIFLFRRTGIQVHLNFPFAPFA